MRVGMGPTIVGVGASAGGLEAFIQLLQALPAHTNLAFVFVQHLSPQYESSLPALIGTKTDLRVVQAEDDQQIAPHHVYVIPPNVHMNMVGGRLHLVPRPTIARSSRRSTSSSSRSRWAQNRAVGVILSGTASDGAAGIREIKALGGITIAQTPETGELRRHAARRRSRPGMVDLVLSPAEIAEQLSDVPARHPLRTCRRPTLRGDSTVGEDQLRELFTLLRRASGIDFRHYKTPTVQRRLLRRMALHRLTDIDGYLARLARRSAGSRRRCAQDLLIHVTRFFRDPDSFEAMARTCSRS